MRMPLQRIPLQPVDGVTISILADNLFDGLLVDQGPAKRPQFGPQIPRIPAPLMQDGETLFPLLAQHGFSALVTLTEPGRTHQILFDTGVTPDAVVENIRLFDLSPKAIETLSLTPAHFHHPTAL